jgi:hypothetical protein
VTVAILLDTDRVVVLSQHAPGVLAQAPWNPETPEEVVAVLSAQLPARTSAVLVVGLGLLEVSQPELPPLAPDVRRTLLLRDADRYFPVSAPVAVSWTNGFACAVDAQSLNAWTRAFGTHFTVRGTATVVECLARANADGSWTMPAGPGQLGRVAVRQGAVVEVRRQVDASVAANENPGRAPSITVGTSAPQVRSAVTAAAGPLDLLAVARGAATLVNSPLDAMLLDESLHRQFAGGRRQRWLASAAAFIIAIVTLAWAANHRRDRQLDATLSETRAIAVSADAGMRASERLQRANAELGAIANARTDPGVVLERLGALLPKDAFIQRLEWDGDMWRIDGSALDAPRIVPLLDASPAFDDVRIVAASTRFLDGGRQRESFSIAFRARSPGTAAAEHR